MPVGDRSSDSVMSTRGERRPPLELDEGDTVAYTGPYLAELLGSAEMRALAHLDVNVERTVVMPGSPSTVTEQSSVSIPPVAYTLSEERSVVDRSPGPAPSRLGIGVAIATFGIMFGLLAGTFISAKARDAASGSVSPRAAKRELVDEKTPLAGAPRAKAFNAPIKRHGRFSLAGIRSVPSAAASAAAPAHSEESGGDEELIRAAQLERSL